MATESTLTGLDLEALMSERAWLVRIAERLVRDRADAEDLAQDALILALGSHRAAAATSRGALRGWLAATVMNQALEIWRSRRSRSGREQRAARPEPDESNRIALDRVELREEIARHVRRLSEPYRTAVVLRYFEECSYAEIAERMGSGSVVTSRQHAARGIRELRERLDRGGRGRDWFRAAVLVVRDAAPAAGGLGPPAFVAPVVAGLAAVGLALFLVGPEPPSSTEVKRGTRLARLERDGAAPLVSTALPLQRVPAVVEPRSAPPKLDGDGLGFRVALGRDAAGQPLRPGVPLLFRVNETGRLDLMGQVPTWDGPPPPASPLFVGWTDADGYGHAPLASLRRAHARPGEDLAPLYAVEVERGPHTARGQFALDPASDPRGRVFVLERGARVHGRLVDKYREPIAGAAIVLDLDASLDTAIGSTAEDGSFVVDHISDRPTGFAFGRDDVVRSALVAPACLHFVQTGTRGPAHRSVEFYVRDEAAVALGEVRSERAPERTLPADPAEVVRYTVRDRVTGAPIAGPRAEGPADPYVAFPRGEHFHERPFRAEWEAAGTMRVDREKLAEFARRETARRPLVWIAGYQPAELPADPGTPIVLEHDVVLTIQIELEDEGRARLPEVLRWFRRPVYEDSGSEGRSARRAWRKFSHLAGSGELRIEGSLEFRVACCGAPSIAYEHSLDGKGQVARVTRLGEIDTEQGRVVLVEGPLERRMRPLKGESDPWCLSTSAAEQEARSLQGWADRGAMRGAR